MPAAAALLRTCSILSSLAARRLAPRVSCSRPRPACLSGWRHTHFRILACASYRAVHLEWKEVFQYLELAFTVCKACRFDGRNILRHFFITQETQTVLTIESPVSRRLFASYLMTDWYFEASRILKCWVKPKKQFSFLSLPSLTLYRHCPSRIPFYDLGWERTVVVRPVG